MKKASYPFHCNSTSLLTAHSFWSDLYFYENLRLMENHIKLKRADINNINIHHLEIYRSIEAFCWTEFFIHQLQKHNIRGEKTHENKRTRRAKLLFYKGRINTLNFLHAMHNFIHIDSVLFSNCKNTRHTSPRVSITIWYTTKNLFNNNNSIWRLFAIKC